MASAATTKRGTIGWIALASVAVVLACSGYQYEPGAVRIKLPKDVDPNASVFRANVQAAFPNPSQTHDRLRPATCSSGGGNKCIVLVHIDVLGDTRKVDPAKAPTAGFAIAHLANTDGTDREAYFNLKPQSAADYYVWVDDDGTGKPRYTLLELPSATNTVVATRQWKVKLCHPYDGENPPTPSDFDFYEFKHGSKPCTLPDATTGSRANYASLTTEFPFSALARFVKRAIEGETMALRGSWIECGSGCCT